MKKKFLPAFSLMEMMVVLLIVAIVAAASAPMISKKMMRTTGTGDSPWVFTGNGNNIAYNMAGDNNATAIIGENNVPNNLSPGLYINMSNNNIENSPQILLQRSGNLQGTGSISFAQELNATLTPRRGRLSIGNLSSGNQSIIIGHTNNYTGNNSNSIPTMLTVLGRGIQINRENTDGTLVIGNGFQIPNSNVTRPYNIIIGMADNNNRTPVGGNVYNALVIGRNCHITDTYWNDTGDLSIKDSAIAIGHNALVNGHASIALGKNARVDAVQALAIGHGTHANAQGSIAIGADQVYSEGRGSIAIGIGMTPSAGPATRLEATGPHSIAIGVEPQAKGDNAIAFGHNAKSNAKNSAAICGYNPEASHENSIAIGSYARTTASNQIVLGSATSSLAYPPTVVIPGYLRVNPRNILGTDNKQIGVSIGGTFYPLVASGNPVRTNEGKSSAAGGVGDGVQTGVLNQRTSDRRLKNVGDKFTGGLEELKKLEIFNYTFKNDEKKSPKVGVMAQDLQKVFPISVTEGDDGYLSIRWDEMFYAAINAIKELDNKITAITEQIKSYFDKVEKLEAQVESQKQTIDSLEKRIEYLEKHLK